MLELNVDQEKKMLRCVFSGRLDTAVSSAALSEIETRLANLNGGAEWLLIADLCGVTYVTSMFLRLCLTLAKRQGGSRFSVVGCTPMVRKVFLESGFEGLFPVE